MTPLWGRRSRWAARLRGLVVPMLVVAAVATGCGGDGGGDDETAGRLSDEGRRGQEVAREQGCTGCHSADGRGGIGPTFQGLYGSEVELQDGTTVVADEEYLVRSIEDPNAQIREGYTGIMPRRDLAEDELDAVLTYLRELG